MTFRNHKEGHGNVGHACFLELHCWTSAYQIRALSPWQQHVSESIISFSPSWII